MIDDDWEEEAGWLEVGSAETLWANGPKLKTIADVRRGIQADLNRRRVGFHVPRALSAPPPARPFDHGGAQVQTIAQRNPAPAGPSAFVR